MFWGNGEFSILFFEKCQKSDENPLKTSVTMGWPGNIFFPKIQKDTKIPQTDRFSKIHGGNFS